MTTESRLDRIETILEGYIQASSIQISTMSSTVEALSHKIDNYVSVSTTVLSRSALLDDLVVGLHGITGHLDDNITILQANLIGLQNNLMTIQANSESHQRNFELHQRDFDENQQSTNAALERLEAILLRLIDRQTPP